VKLHVVKEGDTLWGIAQKYGVSLDELIKANPQIQNPDMIHPGMKIKIPSAAEPQPELIHKHKVQQGDTLWKLAKAWGIPLSSLIKANPHLKNPNALLTGEIVNIPKVPGKPPQSSHAPVHGGAYGKADTSVKPAEQAPVKPTEPMSVKPAEPMQIKPAEPIPGKPAEQAPAPAAGFELTFEVEKFTDLFKAVPIPPLEAGAQPKEDYCPPGEQPAQIPQSPHPGLHAGLQPWPYGYAPDLFHGLSQPMAGGPGWAAGKPDCGCGGSGAAGGAGKHPAYASDLYPGLGAGWSAPMDAAYSQSMTGHPAPYMAADPYPFPSAPMMPPQWQPPVHYPAFHGGYPVMPFAGQPYHQQTPQAGMPGCPPATDYPPMPGFLSMPGYPPAAGYLSAAGYPMATDPFQPQLSVYPAAGTKDGAGGRPEAPDRAAESSNRKSAPEPKESKAKTLSQENQDRKSSKSKGKLKTAAAPSVDASRRKRSRPWTIG
jgi:morphogenetic protein associated with SpoVID